jgi:hypothetical protein
MYTILSVDTSYILPDASNPLYIYIILSCKKIIIKIKVIYIIFILIVIFLQFNILIKPIYISRVLTILQPPASLQPVFTILYNSIL